MGIMNTECKEFRMYVELVRDNLNKEHHGYTEEHHILPVSLSKWERYKTNPLKLVKLSYHNHVLAHYYLWKITGAVEMARALVYMVDNKARLEDITIE